MTLKQIDPTKIDDKFIDMIGNEWMLITSGNMDSFNMMTASWGFLGYMWGLPAATCFLRPTRYTKEWVDRTHSFTISFFPDKYKKNTDYPRQQKRTRNRQNARKRTDADTASHRRCHLQRGNTHPRMQSDVPPDPGRKGIHRYNRNAQMVPFGSNRPPHNVYRPDPGRIPAPHRTFLKNNITGRQSNNACP